MKRPAFHFRVGPPIVVFASIYFILCSFVALVALVSNRVQLPAARADYQSFLFLRERLCCITLILACVYFGFNRPAVHPIFNRRYLHWLAGTPWNYRLPLPLGPVHLIWRDALLLAVLSALGEFDLGMNPAYVLVAFGAAYLLRGTGALSFIHKPTAVLLRFGLGSLLLAIHSPGILAAIIVAMYLVFYAGLKRSLKDFPWGKADRPVPTAQSLAVSAGWPFGTLSPRLAESGLSYTAAITIAAQSAWWIYCVGRIIEELAGSAPNQVFAIVIAIGFIIALIRWGVYRRICAPPMSILGRIGSGRLIIPRYDCILAGPLAACATTIAVATFAREFPVSASFFAAVAVGAGLLVALAAGPSLNWWRLSGEHPVTYPRKRPVSFRMS